MTMEFNKNLPIKIVQKRKELDERQTEGGGDDTPRKWVLEGDELRIRSEELLEELKVAETTIETRLKKYESIPTIIKAKVIEDALAKSHRKEIAQLFHSKGLEKTIGFSEEQELYIRIDTANEISEINKKLVSFERNAKAISAVKEIQAYDPVVIRDEAQYFKKDGKYVLKVKLFNYHNYQLNITTEEVFKKLIQGNEHIKLEKEVRYSENLKVFEVTTDTLDALDLISDFSGLKSIEPMPMFEVTEDDFFVEIEVEHPEPDEGKQYPIVGVLDSGIAQISQLRPWIIGKHSSVPPELTNKSHGTFVSGIVGFGDRMEGRQFTGVDGCYLFDATVIPDLNKDRISEADLIANIREVIEKNKDEIKIWNMSLGSENEIFENLFSDYAEGLDNIQDQNGVLIIKSAGNCKNFESGKPVGKIARGADSVRSLTVGSIAHSQQVGDLAKVNYPSPFSRIGPGPAFIVKPELVHYGGNCSVDNGRAVANGVTSFRPDGTYRKTVGTSFSTPRVSAIAADLQNKLQEDFDPILIKALMIHSAKYSDGVELETNEKLNQMGFGVPSIANDILFNNPNEVTIVIRDSINKGEFIEILDFPYPESLIDREGFYNGQIIVTVVNEPILMTGQAVEYCQSNIEVKFGTYDQKKLRDITQRTIKNQLGKEGAQNLLSSSFYSKKKSPENLKEFAQSEKMLIQYGNKFYPNKKYAVDLSELTKGNKEKYVQAPKNWYLKVDGLYRSFIEYNAEIERKDLTQEFCIIVTIRDPEKKANVYQETTRLLDAHNFLHRNIKLRQDIDIRFGE